MKLARIGLKGAESPVVVDPRNEMLVLVQGIVGDYTQSWLRSGGFAELQKVFAHIKKGTDGLPRINPKDAGRFGSPIVPAKIRCVGMNYSKHARESGSPDPLEPVIFNKDADGATGPYDPMPMPIGPKQDMHWKNPASGNFEPGMPSGCLAFDYEVEKAFVTLDSTYGVTADEVKKNLSKYILGYVAMNDISERNWQLRSVGGLWELGKSGTDWAAFAPYLVTTDEVSNPDNLRLWSKVNGEVRQDSNTSDTIFKDPYILSYVSQFAEIPPMTVFSTGTPEGVGMVKGYLSVGDEVEWCLEGCGPSGKHTVVKWDERLVPYRPSHLG